MKSLVDDTSKTSVYLKNLIELEIMEWEFSVSDGIKEKANTNRGLYHLTDNFFRFWYAFVFTNYSELEGGDVDGVYEYAIAPQLHEFAASVNEYFSIISSYSPVLIRGLIIFPLTQLHKILLYDIKLRMSLHVECVVLMSRVNPKK